VPDDPTPQRILVLGPAGSGKSAMAERLVAHLPDAIYVATGPVPGPDDTEWAAKIAVHRARRPATWSTIETDDTEQLAMLLTSAGPAVLVESLGTWLAAALQRPDPDAEIAQLIGAWAHAARHVVLVSEETGWGVIPSTAVGRAFRSALGPIASSLAEQADHVLLVVAGRVIELPRTATLPHLPELPLTSGSPQRHFVASDRHNGCHTTERATPSPGH
jgi:adenosylcobinamide kinase/adenosylcobinamide-phosphate guanylyltransferase